MVHLAGLARAPPVAEHLRDLAAAHQRAQVGEERGRVAVGDRPAAHRRRGRHQAHRGLGDDPELTEPGEHGLEQVAVRGRRAAAQLAVARDDLQLVDVVDLGTGRDGRWDPAHRQRAADGEAEVAGGGRDREAAGCAARASSSHVVPAPTVARSGPMEPMAASAVVSTTTPPGASDCPPVVLPRPRAATGMRCVRQYPTIRATSAAEPGRSTAAGSPVLIRPASAA